jgi:peptidoglycan/xylan/chitin deacetylase (PgdA/CDA1 family)
MPRTRPTPRVPRVRDACDALQRITTQRNVTLILCYHRVAEDVEDPFHLCVHPNNFAAHLEEITRWREPSTLSSLSLSSRRPRVVVTFDDGYSDNLDAALPIAEAKGVPITVFVTSGMLGNPSGFWWDRLGALLRARPNGTSEFSAEIGGRSVKIPIGAGDLESDLGTVRRHLLPLPVKEIERVLDGVSQQWSVASTSPPDALPLTRDGLRQLAAAELVTIGAHTVDHVRLRERSSEEQLQTIASSKQELERLLDRRVCHFAYPFGRGDDFDDETVDAVRLADFETACTTLPGNASPSTDRYRLPRRLVMNWGRARFRAQLQRWRLG